MNQGINPWGWFSLLLGWGFISALTFYCFTKVLSAKKKPGQMLKADEGEREHWGSRIGLILAVAGNAIGLGNFLRFPVKAAANGGGAFLIPYFCALVFLGIPMMWIEWTIGRYGGIRGHGTTPGMLQLMWKHPAAKYLGALGITIPFAIVVYYNFIESWCLSFGWFSLSGKYFGHTTREAMGGFLQNYQGVTPGSTLLPALLFTALTLALNFFFLYKGISKGIEVLAKIGMPLLFLFGIVLAIRVLTLGTPDPTLPANNIANGMAFIWNPDFSMLKKAEVWLTAAGQIFFTLSLGEGIINTYASYLREDEDIALNGITTASTNEFAEVILGGTIAIPAAVAFFGIEGTKAIAQSGAFDLGFQALPVIFQKIPLGHLFGALWFFLLFIAGITSSVALTQPAIAFLEDEFHWSRKRAVCATFCLISLCTLLVVLFFKHGFLDEMDFWVGTFGLVVFAFIESLLFSWIFGIDKAWEELHKGGDVKIPKLFKYVMKYVTPLYLGVIVIAWTFQDAIGKLVMKGEPHSRHPYLWGARALMVGLLLITLFMVRRAWKMKERAAEER